MVTPIQPHSKSSAASDEAEGPAIIEAGGSGGRIASYHNHQVRKQLVRRFDKPFLGAKRKEAFCRMFPR